MTKQIKILSANFDLAMLERAGHINATPLWKDVSYVFPLSEAPVVLVGLRTFNGPDTAQVRIKDLSKDVFWVKIEEERSKDPKMHHAEEVVDYIVFSSGIIRDSSDKEIEEAGIIEFDQPNPHVWRRLISRRGFRKPVAFAQVLSYNGPQPVHVRICDVGLEALYSLHPRYWQYLHGLDPVLYRQQSFLLKMEEWQYQDMKHLQEKIGYVLLEEGTHELPNNSRIHVDRETSVTSAWREVKRHTNNPLVPTMQDKVNPNDIVVTQSQTFNQDHPIVTRMDITDYSRFRVRVQEEEAAGSHPEETIGYVIVSPS